MGSVQKGLFSKAAATWTGGAYETVREHGQAARTPLADFFNTPHKGEQPMTLYQDLANRVLEGTGPTRQEGLAILDTPQDELLDLVNAAYRIRSRYFGNTVRLQMLLNAKSGACQEDCHYCSQSTDRKSVV